jgi:hypothetical protein
MDEKHTPREWEKLFREGVMLRAMYRLDKFIAALPEPAVLTYRFIKKPIAWLIPPHYLKHPTEDREVTWRQWKKAQKAIIRREKRLYDEMYAEHGLNYRGAVWLSRKMEKPLLNWMVWKIVQGYRYIRERRRKREGEK